MPSSWLYNIVSLQKFTSQETFFCLINKYLSPRYIPGKTSSYELIYPPVDGAGEVLPLFCEFGSNTYCLAQFCRFTILYVIKIHQPVNNKKEEEKKITALNTTVP